MYLNGWIVWWRTISNILFWNRRRRNGEKAKFKSSTNVQLVSAICNVYYGEDLEKVIDILKENEVSDRKKPRSQIEHFDGDYWFIIDEVDFSSIAEFDKTKIEIEVIIEDSLGNTYKQIKGVD